MKIEIDKAAFKNQTSDRVSFTYKIGKEEYTHPNVPCYLVLFAHSKYQLKCYPNYEGVLPNEIYSRFMYLAKENKILLPNCSFYTVDKRHMLFFPENNYVKNVIYPSLCMYRYTDSTPLIPWDVVHLVEQGINFFQALYYAVSKYSINTGHDFLTPSGSYYEKTKKLSVSYSVAASLYFKNKFVSLTQKPFIGYVQDEIRQFAHDNNFKMFLCEGDKFLSKEYVPLYEKKDTTTEEFNETCEKLS